MMVLCLGYYDYPFYSCAYVLAGGQISLYKIDDKDLDDFYDLTCSYKEEEHASIKKRLSTYFEKFDKIIVCDNGRYEVIE